MRDQCSFVEPMGRLFKSGRHIDIFTFVDKGDGTVEIPMELRNTPRKLLKFNSTDVYPIQNCRFMGIENAKCPRNKVALLKGYFGDNLEPEKICKEKQWVKNK